MCAYTFCYQSIIGDPPTRTADQPYTQTSSPATMETEREGAVVHHTPTMIRTPPLTTNSYNVRRSPPPASRHEQHQTPGKVNGPRGAPRGATQPRITNIQSESHMHPKFNPRASEVPTARTVPNEFHPPHVSLLHTSAHNTHTVRPPTPSNPCPAQTPSMGHNSYNVTPFHAPPTVRRQLHFPIRRNTRPTDSAGDTSHSCTQCAVEAHNPNIDV